jgi:hypothetical protein
VGRVDPQELYWQVTDKSRQVLNRSFFRRLHFDADDQGP